MGCTFEGWAHGLGFHNLGGSWRSWAATVKNINNKLKMIVKCFSKFNVG